MKINLESQVCSLELAMRLNELGVKQDSLFYHCINVKKFSENDIEAHLIAMRPAGEEYYSAFTASELGEMLPLWWDSGKRGDKDYICRVFKINVTETMHTFGNSEADARAKMLIDLIENELIPIQGTHNAT